MDMVRHQAKAVYTVAKALDSLLDEEIKAVSVFIVKENLLPGVAAEYDVVTCTRVMETGFAWHGYIIPLSCNLAILTPLFSRKPWQAAQ